MRSKKSYIIFIVSILLLNAGLFAQDSSTILRKVTVTGIKKIDPFSVSLPAQSLNTQLLQQINAPSAGDAARFFSGVQVKDYGGIGGLKTISVRSLGASHTGITYDGVPVSDAQSGQIDLSRYSSTFINSIDLYNANMPGTILPARTFSSAAVLSIYSRSYYPSLIKHIQWQAGMQAGSFGLFKPFVQVNFGLKKNLFIGLNAEAVSSKGDYPIIVVNGNLSEKKKRNNSAIRSLQTEVNLLKFFSDSSSLQLKGWTYSSKRGLPGVIIFFNDRSVQQLWNNDYFIQSRYKRNIGRSSSLLLLAKFNHNYTRYTDPDFLNNAGGLDERYRQGEAYFSVAIERQFNKNFSAAFSSDIAYAGLKANKTNFAEPTRLSNWSNALLTYADSVWQINASVLWSAFSDKIKLGQKADRKDEFTPTFAISRKIAIQSPLLLRVFYKQVFRMPTFNDLYYNFIGNTNLRPEYSRQYNFGIAYSKRFTKKLKHFSISADGYYNTIKDKIVAVPGQNLFTWTMLNLGKVEIKGIDVTTETGGTIHTNINWFARIAYTWQQAIDMTDPSGTNYKDRIPYTPDHSGSGIFSISYRKWNAGYSLTFSGTRYMPGDNSYYTQLDGWGSHDVFVSRGFSFDHLNMDIKFELNNITNTRYDVIRFYPMPGRSFKIAILFKNI